MGQHGKSGFDRWWGDNNFQTDRTVSTKSNNDDEIEKNDFNDGIRTAPGDFFHPKLVRSMNILYASWNKDVNRFAKKDKPEKAVSEHLNVLAVLAMITMLVVNKVLEEESLQTFDKALNLLNDKL